MKDPLEDQAVYDEMRECPKCGEHTFLEYCPKCKRKLRRDRSEHAIGEGDLVERFSANIGKRLCDGFYNSGE
jgi:hypothetical protein